MRKIYLIRHGQSTANAGGEAQPNSQIPLTQLGHKQAHSVAQWVQHTLGDHIESISVSSFLRTQQTAQPLLERVAMSAQIIEGLQEFNYLSFSCIEGRDFATRLALMDEYWASAHPEYSQGADAESFAQFYQRVAKVLSDFEQFEDGNHVVYTHGFWISMLIWQLLGQSAQSDRDVVKFRQFEQSIRAQNGEVFCLTLPAKHSGQSYPPSITKVRSCPNQNSDLSAQ